MFGNYEQYYRTAYRTAIILFKVSVAIQARAVVGDELLALLGGYFALLDGLADPCFETAHKALGVVLHILEHISHGFTINGLVDAVTIFVDGDVHGVGVAEEVVHVAQNLLVGSYKEHANVVVLALAEGMQRQVGRLLVVVDVGRYFAVRVAGDVL